MTAQLENWSVEVAKDYLQTVVVVDDRVAIEPPGNANAPGDNEILNEVDELTVPAEGEEPADHSASVVLSSRSEEAETEGLDGAALSEAFARYGLVCGYVRPANPQQREALIEGAFDRLFMRSDVLILDWSLNGDIGQTTTRLVSRLVEPKEGKLGRLRLICIYTNDPDLYAVRDVLRQSLSSAGHELEVSEGGDGLGLIARDFRVSVLGKPDVSRGPLPAESVVAEGGLPERIVKEFAQASHGILPGFALKSLSLLRDNAPALLQRFRNDLDPAFVSHNLLAGEGKRFAIQLIAREVQSLLESTGAADAISPERIISWARDRYADSSFAPKVQKKNAHKEIDPARVLELLAQEPPKVSSLIDVDGGQLGIRNMATVASLFTTPEKANASEEELGRLSCFARDLHSGYSRESEPTLQLGTLVVRTDEASTSESVTDLLEQAQFGESKHDFWLCLQPLCDSERLDEPRAFPMIPLAEVKLGSEFSFLALDHRKRSRVLAGKSKLHDMRMVRFSPTGGERVVRSVKKGGVPCFTSDSNEEFLWIGELRPEHALRVSHEMARLISRVGLDESEWLRNDGYNK
ncbi:response regulator receiver domain [Streptomyces sp. NPDC055793]